MRDPVRRFLLIALIGLTTSPASAAIRPGIEVGVNFSTLRYDLEGSPLLDAWEQGWRSSFTAGATLEIPFGTRFSLLTGIRYVQQGNQVKFDVTDPSPQVGEFEIISDYLSFPALLTWRPFDSRRFFISLGPEIGLLRSARSEIETSVPPTPRQEQDIEDMLEGTNLWLDAMAGYEFPALGHVGVLSLRYTHGLTGAAQEDEWISDWKTQGIELLAGMRW